MKETYYIFKEEDLKHVSGPVQNEWDKTAIFKQELLDICKKVTVDDEKLNNTDNFDACTMDVEEAMQLHQVFTQRLKQWLDDYNKKLLEKKQAAVDALKEENDKLKETVGDIKAPVPSYNVTPPAIFATCFNGDTYYKCPHCMNSFECFEMICNEEAKTEETGIYICPKCKTRFKL